MTYSILKSILSHFPNASLVLGSSSRKIARVWDWLFPWLLLSLSWKKSEYVFMLFVEGEGNMTAMRPLEVGRGVPVPFPHILAT